MHKTKYALCLESVHVWACNALSLPAIRLLFDSQQLCVEAGKTIDGIVVSKLLKSVMHCNAAGLGQFIYAQAVFLIKAIIWFVCLRHTRRQRAVDWAGILFRRRGSVS